MVPSATCGGVAWLWLGVSVWIGGGPVGLIELLFLLAPLVLVPLALRAAEARIPAWLSFTQPPAAFAAAASFLMPRGWTAAAAAAAWSVLTVVLAIRGLSRLRRAWRVPAEISAAAGAVLLPVGGGWLVLSRLGASPLGFEEPIVLLTAVHFHYAAFLTLTLVALAGRVLASRPIYRAIVAGTVAGTPMLAAGITVWPLLELAGALVLTASLWAFSASSLRHVVPRARGASRVLLGVSALSLWPSMALAVAYAWGQWADHPTVALSTVAFAHGPLNALGFALCGLLGWSVPASPRADSPVEEGRRAR